MHEGEEEEEEDGIEIDEICDEIFDDTVKFTKFYKKSFILINLTSASFFSYNNNFMKFNYLNYCLTNVIGLIVGIKLMHLMKFEIFLGILKFVLL